MKRHLGGDCFPKTTVAVANGQLRPAFAIHRYTMMKALIFISIIAILTILVFETLYFRRGIFVLTIPTAVVVSTVVGIMLQEKRLIWPIIGISFFHIFLAAYGLLIFSYFFFFKPLYIIMVLNWAFDTLYTQKTASYYIQCATIYSILTIFLIFNIWQSRVSLRFYSALSVHNNEKSTVSEDAVSAISATPTTEDTIPSSKVLNEPPVVFPNRNGGRLHKTRTPNESTNQVTMEVDGELLQNAFSLSGRDMANSMAVGNGYGSRRSSIAECRRFAI